MEPIIYLKSELMGNGNVKVDLMLQNPPKNFAGVAFDLDIEGKWNLVKTDLGNVLQKEDVLFLVQQQAKLGSPKLIFGLTLKAPSLEKYRSVNGGVLATFEIKTSQAQLSGNFKNMVLSVEQNGRQDLKNVVWRAGEFFVNTLKPTQQEFMQQQFSQTQQPDDSLPQEFGVAGGGGGFGLNNELQQVYLFLVLVLAAVFLVAIGIFLRAKNRRSKKLI